jgi:hypothetical protein
MANYQELQAEARDYYDLCDRARAFGIDTTATDETGTDPDAVAKLRAEVERREAEAAWERDTETRNR